MITSKSPRQSVCSGKVEQAHVPTSLLSLPSVLSLQSSCSVKESGCPANLRIPSNLHGRCSTQPLGTEFCVHFHPALLELCTVPASRPPPAVDSSSIPQPFPRRAGEGPGGGGSGHTCVECEERPGQAGLPRDRPGVGPPAAAPTWPRPSSHSKNPTRASGATIPAVPWKAGSIFVVGSHASTKDCPNQKPTEDSSLPKKKGQRRGL